jgi:hypothetical protein
MPLINKYRNGPYRKEELPIREAIIRHHPVVLFATQFSSSPREKTKM